MTQPTSSVSSKQTFDLTPLENLIKSELEYWLSYLREVRSDEKLSYTEILNTPDDNTTTTTTTTTTSAKTKIHALRHILETLPLRHKALASAYNTPPEFQLSDHLTTLLETKNEVVAMEKEVVELEDARLEELKGLLKVLEDVKVLIGEGYVGKEEVEGLVAAMDAVGLHCDEEQVRGYGKGKMGIGDGSFEWR
ncbi:uncharacterized protein MYCFIDRAFT_77171 [Pseudocercospora fijiensis CIRAD86]|uniref:Uncharacterized protein n=1 Tax=Pseudocercospora fijiensis (strain CIRAD86) TaxID=383855 RepID=M3BD21_PSEFD|nr:uncharacterized protein MYCFIDRAFT_77171 [Pseudocercospora fijiensis CIRAD86]EME87053.1 hypothetical protein MYCFIDRAFT_77171 [Pseudocercospora fijiensis CIRAD86]